MQPAAQPARDFIDLIGLELDEVSADRVTAHLPVRPELHQPFGRRPLRHHRDAGQRRGLGLVR